LVGQKATFQMAGETLVQAEFGGIDKYFLKNKKPGHFFGRDS